MTKISVNSGYISSGVMKPIIPEVPNYYAADPFVGF